MTKQAFRQISQLRLAGREKQISEDFPLSHGFHEVSRPFIMKSDAQKSRQIIVDLRLSVIFRKAV